MKSSNPFIVNPNAEIGNSDLWDFRYGDSNVLANIYYELEFANNRTDIVLELVDVNWEEKETVFKMYIHLIPNTYSKFQVYTGYYSNLTGEYIFGSESHQLQYEEFVRLYNEVIKSRCWEKRIYQYSISEDINH